MIREHTQAGDFDLFWIEQTIKSAALREAAGMLERIYSRVLPELLGVMQPEGSRGSRTRSVLSTVGPLQLTRAYVVNKEGERSFPLDSALRLTGGCTPAAAGLLCWAGAQCSSYDQASEALHRLAYIEAPGRRVQRMVNQCAPLAREWAAKRGRDQHKGGILNIQCDMTGIPMRKEDLTDVKGRDGAPKKRQVKGGIVFRQELNAQGEVQRVPDSTTRVVSFDDVTTFSRMLHREAVNRGYFEADTVVFTADGAEWIWLMVEDRFKGVVQIVDFYHAAQHLAELCHLAVKDKEKAKAMFAMRRGLMKRYGAACIIRYFEQIPSDHPYKTDIEKALGYFRDNIHRMDYGNFRKSGYCIGSGAMEGTCKSLVNQRTDLAGQRWHPKGALNVLHLRALVADGLHDEYWKKRSTLCLPNAA